MTDTKTNEERDKKSEKNTDRSEQQRKRAEELRKEAEQKEARQKELQAEQARREAETKGLPNSEVKKPDGSIVKTGANGRVSEVINALGEVTKFGYDKNGQLNSFTDKSGTWSTTDGVKWTQGGNTKEMRADVYNDGRFAFSDGKQLTVRRTDGTTLEQNLHNQQVQIKDSDGRILETHVGEGPSHRYEYDGGTLKKVTTADGATWQRNQDGTFTSSDGKVYTNVNVDADGSLKYTDQQGNQYVKSADDKVQVTKPVDEAAMQAAADKIFTACDGAGTWEDDIFQALDGKSEAERKRIEELYQQQHGISLRAQLEDELSGTDLTRAMYLLTRRDEPTQQDAPAPIDQTKITDAVETIHTASDGAGTWEEDIYQALQGKTKAEIAEMDKQYKAKYGMSLEEQMRDEMEGEDLYKAMQLLKGSDAAQTPAVTEEAKAQVDRKSMEEAADAFYGHTAGRDGTGEDEVNALLKDKTEAEKAVMNEIYLQKYGKTLEQELYDEMSGSDLEKSLALLNKRDGDADDAGRLHTNLVEMTEYTGRSDYNVEKDIRQTISTMNSEEIAKLDAEYQKRYGKTLKEALLSDPNLTQQTKDALEIYLKGTDKRSNEDNQKLFQNALDARDVEMFNEAMALASPESRAQFMKEGGKQKIVEHFFEDPAGMQHALDYAQFGRMTTAGKVRDNTSLGGDNEEAIERALKEMPPEERRAYLQGKQLAEGKKVEGLSPEQEEYARKTYESLHSALTSAGYEWEVTKWEDQIAVPGGSLVTKLAAHNGSVYDDSLHMVLKDIEGMTEQDWQRYKSDESYRKQVDITLKDYLNDAEYARAKQVLDAKMSQATYETAKTAGNRDINTIIADNEGTFENDEEAIWDSIENMSEADQTRYRTDVAYRKQVNEAVIRSLEYGDERDVAQAMLARVLKGESPKADIIDKLNKQASNTDTDEAQVIRDLQEEFDKDPALRERILHPKTEEERKFAEKFNIALHRALDDSEYERYAKPLMETGHLSSEIQMELNAGNFDDDEQGYYKDMVRLAKANDPASQAEKQKILNDAEYREKVFYHLNEEERKIAMNALQQGEMRPEDMIYSQMVGAGTGEEEIKAALRDLTPEQKEQVKKEFARKYGYDLTDALLDELGGQDSRDAQRLIEREATSDREAFNRTRDEVNESRDGIGRAWVDSMWDGTGYMTDDAVLNYQKRLATTHARFDELAPEEQKQLRESVQKNLDAFVQSKGAAADMVVDAVIIAAAIAGAKFTGGASLSLIMYTTLAGALFKVATKAAIMGADYDWNSTQVVSDFLTGAIDTGTLFLGPAQLGMALKLGEKGAAKATQKLVEEGAEQLIKAEMRQQLGKEMFKMVSTAISHGEEAVSDKAIAAMAKKFAVSGQEEALALSIKTSLKEGMEQETRSALKRMATETALNMGAGAGGGGGSGAVRGGLEWDSSKSVQENLFMVAQQAGMGAAMGGGMAGVFTIGFKAIGHGITSGAERYRNLTKPPDDVKVTLKANETGSVTISAADNAHVEAVQHSDGSITQLKPGESVTLRDGDVPVVRTDDAGNPVDVAGRRVNSDGTPYRDGVPVELGAVKSGEGAKTSEATKAAYLEAAENLPPVPENHVRLYRGVDSKGIQFDELPPLTAAEKQRFSDVLQKGPPGWTNEDVEFIKYARDRIKADEAKFYSDDLESAVAYAGEGGKVSYIDVMPSEITRKPSFGLRGGGGTSFEVPYDVAKSRAVELTPNRSLSRVSSEVATPKGTFEPKPVSVDGGPNSLVRVYTIDGKNYILASQGDVNWFQAGGGGNEHAPIKIHVTTNSADDLGKLQQVLIPALNEDPTLQALVGKWKTLDPQWAHDPTQVGNPLEAPGSTAQKNKAFTIYAENPADAVKIQKRVDEILTERGLKLDSPIESGNLDKVRGSSNRVGIVRDGFEPAMEGGVVNGAKIDEQVAARIHADYGVAPGGKLNATQLRELETKLGLQNEILAYDDSGNLMLRGSHSSELQKNGDFYLDESHAGKGVDVNGRAKTDRPALYELYEHYGFDPVETYRDSALSTAPDRTLTFDGTEVRTQKSYTVGRAETNDIKLTDPAASRHQMLVDIDTRGNMVVTDLGSSNGTFVNGRRLGPNERYALRPGDKLTVGKTEIPWEATYTNKFTARVGNSEYPLKVGQEVPVGNRGNTRLGMNQDGLYIKDSSTAGTYISRDGDVIRVTKDGAYNIRTGEQVAPAGEAFKLRSTDEVWIGDVPGGNGERLSLRRLDSADTPSAYNAKPSQQAVQQSNNFARNHELSDKLEDGFHQGGQYRTIDGDGKALWGKQPITVLDKAELAPIIKDARERFANLPPKARAKALAQYVHDLLTPAGMSEKELNNWYLKFVDENPGQRIGLSKFVQEGKGVCSQQALLLKALGDELGLDVKLVRGNATNGGNEINHIWAEVDYGEGSKIFDPRMETYDVARESLPNYKSGTDIVKDQGNITPSFRSGDTITYNDQPGWVVEGFDGQTGDVRLKHYGSRPIKPGAELNDFQQLNADMITRDRGLRVGQQYQIRRSDGRIEPWRLDRINSDGSLSMSSDSAYREVVPRAVLANRPLVELGGGDQKLMPKVIKKAKLEGGDVTNVEAKPVRKNNVELHPDQQAKLKQTVDESFPEKNPNPKRSNESSSDSWLWSEADDTPGKQIERRVAVEVRDKIYRSETDFAKLLKAANLPEGTPTEGWVLRKGWGGADEVGADLILVNTITGEYYPIDIKTNMFQGDHRLVSTRAQDKYLKSPIASTSGAKYDPYVPEDRMRWVIQTKHEDAIKLRAEELAEKMRRDANFRAPTKQMVEDARKMAEREYMDQLTESIVSMIKEGSPLRMDNAKLPSSALSDPAEIEAFIASLRLMGMKQWADHLENGALKWSRWNRRQAGSTR